MADPTTTEEWTERMKANQSVTGIGPQAVIRVPCPFCCERDLIVCTMSEIRKAAADGAVCRSCGRGARALFNGTVYAETVQTQGIDPPECMPITVRRAE